MAVKTDLTFEELNAALGSAAFSVSGNDIVVSVGAITGDNYAALADMGVIEFLFKLRSACSTAQDAANEGLQLGEQLDSFPGFSYSPPADGYVVVTQTHTVQIPLDTATVIGTNA